ncbi:MAG: ATP-binding cassette domain-containing protein [Alistipes sp.]|nr:ATP-binding cassette domain-containing protein [Candidatus Alistipes equi]
MGKWSIYSSLPLKYRRRGYLVSFTIFLRALLNFAGLAALLPVLYLILDASNIHSNPILEYIYRCFSFTSTQTFIIVISISILLFIIFKNLLNLFLYRFERDYIYALFRYLSRNMFIDYFNRGLPFIKKNNSAVLSRNVNVVCYTFVAGVLRPVASILSETMLFILLIASIIAYSPMAALLSILVFAPVSWIYIGLYKNHVNTLGKEENEAHRQKYRDVIETYRGYQDIETNNAFPGMLSSFDKALTTIIRTGKKNAVIGNIPQILTEVGLTLGMIVLIMVATYQNSMNAKILFGVFAVAALRLLPSLKTILSAWTSIKYNRYTLDIISEASLKEEITPESTTEERVDFKHSIKTCDLCFRFDDSNRDTIHKLNIEIRKGERVGITGKSGAGKTTLFNLLLGMYQPSSGEILIDGERLTPLTKRKWQNTIGYVSQNVFLQDTSIVENIALGVKSENIDRKRAQKAIEMSSLLAFVEKLPKGMDSKIGECGALLSGGERQRIGIARALYKNADVLFFDEATSSLDSETEQSINASIEHLSKNNSELTIVVIAHRETSLACCQRIIRL